VNRRLAVAFLFTGCAATAKPGDTASTDPDDDGTTTPAESCNGEDDDGDGEIDEGLTVSTWYVDDDGDGRGDDTRTIDDCAQPGGTAPRGGDCDDTDPDVFPGQVEVCNDQDDDCDGTIDGPTSADAVTRYPDADGDGYGLAAEQLCPSEVTPEWSATTLGPDCDDTDPDVHPDAPERCNGIDDDCDPSTDESGAVRFHDFSGSVYDWEDGVLTGQVGLLRPGTLELCGGTHHMVLRPRAAIDIVASPSATGRPTISADLLDGPALLLRDPGLAVTVTGIDLIGGTGTAAIDGEATGGGAIECDTDGSLTLTDVTASGGIADIGGSILVRGGCTLDATGTLIERGEATRAGGLVAVLDGHATFTDSDLGLGTAPVGAGIAVVGWEGDASLTLDHTDLHGCSGARIGGAAYIEDADLTCLGDPAAPTGLYANSALEGGGAWMAAGATFTGTDCDMGSGATDNLVHDVAWDDLGTWGASWSGPATFTCTDEGCE